MTDILIRGVGMPQTCGGCYLCHGMFCFGLKKLRSNKDYRERPDNCPLVELPPHGDLIDRDALKHKFCTHCDGYEHDTGACVDGDQDCMDAKIIMTASVIVPSNKEEGE